MADFKSFVLFVLLCLPLVQSGGPCVDEAYVEGCPSYRLRGLALSTAYLPHSLSFRAERVSKVQLTSDRAFRFNLTDTTKYQVSLEKNGSRICAAIPGILNETCGHWYYLGIDSTSPLLFTLDCVNASHSCRFHRLTRVALHPGADPSVLTWRNRANTTTLSVGITNGKEGALVTLRNAATGTRSYHNITVRGASGGPPCVFSSPVLNLNYTCKKALTPNDFLFIADSKSSYFDLSAFTPEEDVPKETTATETATTETTTTETTTLEPNTSPETSYLASTPSNDPVVEIADAFETQAAETKQNFVRWIKEANLTEDEKEDLKEEYVNNVTQAAEKVLDSQEMTQALEQANSPSDIERVQEAVEKVGLALVDLPTNFTKDLQNDNLHMRVSSQPASYYKNASARRFVSASAPNTSIEFPDQFYKGHVSENESVKIIFTTYRALHSVDNVIPLDPVNASKDDFPADNQVNSKIIGSIMVGAKCWHSAEGYVKLELGHVYKGDAFQIRNIRCVWWDEAARAWNTSGCFLKANDAFHSVCHCNHLTYFSLLMDVGGVRADDDVLESDGHFAARWIGRVGSSASVLCLGLCLVCILALRTLRNTLCWRIRGHLCATLLLAYLLVLTAFKSIGGRVVCAVVGPLLHYALLCVFMWGTVEACNMYVNLVRVWRTQRTLFKYYLGLSYGFPVVVVGLTLGVTRGQAYDTTHTCWLAAGAALWVFVGFLVVILAINFAIFALVMRIVVNNAKDIKNRPYHKRDADVRDRIWGSVTIFVVLGLTWITGILFAIFESSVFSVVFSLTSSFQGVWIFLFGIVLDKRIRRDIVCLMARYRNTYSVFQQSKQQSRSTDNHQVVFSPSNTEKYEEIE